jgi:signal transduction histidine kinase
MLRSTSLRLALACAAAVLVAMLATLAVVWVGAADFQRATFQAAIEADVAELAEVWRRGGPPSLARAVEARAGTDATGRNFWWFADARGATVAGNLARAPRVAGWQTIPVPATPGRGELRVLGFGAELPGGLFLFAARDTIELDRFEAALTRTLLLGGAAAVLFALGAGVLVARGVSRRAAAMNAALAAVAAGEVTRRLPGADGADEFARLAASVNATLDRLEAAMRGLRRVSADIAHDLRTPLTRLRAGLEAALVAADARPAVERAIAETDAVLEIFAAILRISEIEGGDRRAGFAAFDLSAALADVAEAFGLAPGGIAPGITLTGDRTLLQQAVSNLLANAAAHTPAGTPVSLAVAREAGGVAITVADRGPGVSAADRARLGTPFLRLAAARDTPGHGLGLALVRAVATLHGGRLTFEDAQPGLLARLWLPA